MAILILQWNCRGIYRKINELKHLLDNAETLPDILALQETHLTEKYTPKIPGFTMIRKDRDVHGGGVCMFIKNNIPFVEREVPKNENIEVQCICIREIQLFNVYLPPNKNIGRAALTSLLSTSSAKTIIVGDFNAHHPMWSEGITNSYGRNLHHVIELFDLVIMNTNRITRLNLSAATTGARRGSVLDLTIASKDIANRIETTITDCLLDSDHFVIISKIAINAKRICTNVPSWCFRRANWGKYTALCENITSTTVDNAEEAVQNFSKALLHAAKRTIPMTKQHNRSMVPWWNDECSRAKRRKRAAFMKMRRSFKMEDVIEYKKRRAHARKVILTAKKTYWRTFCDSLNSNSNLSKVWNIVKSMTGSRTWSMVKSLKRQDQTLTSQKDIANYFAEHFSKISSSSNYDARFARKKDYFEHIYRSLPRPENSMNPDMNKPFSRSELLDVVRGRKGTSPGIDGIGYPMIANLPTSCLGKLLNLFNRLWSEGICPEIWHHSIIIPILKNAKLDNLNPASYRPISLTSNLCKIMERMINNRLRWWLENNNILQPCQSGFRANRSTKDCIMLLHDDIYKALANKRSTLAVFLDIEKAYDMVWRDGLLHKMRSIGICGNMFRWISSFLGKRKFQVRIGTCF